MLDDDAPRVHGGRVAAIPALGGLAGGRADQRDGAGDLVALVGLFQLVMLDPAIAVAADVPVAGGNRGGGRRIGLERPGAGEQGHRQPVAREDAVQPPPADSRAVFEHALGPEVAAVAGVGAGALDQPGLGNPVAGRVGQLGALFEIDHEVDRDARVARPARMRRLGPVTDKIAAHFFSPGRSGYQSSSRIWSSTSAWYCVQAYKSSYRGPSGIRSSRLQPAPFASRDTSRCGAPDRACTDNSAGVRPQPHPRRALEAPVRRSGARARTTRG